VTHLKRFARDPLITIANSRWLLVGSLAMTILAFAAVFCALEQDNEHLKGHPKYGYWVACYWAITTMTTVGYGDVSAPDAAGQFVSCLLMLWSTFFLLPIAITNVYSGFVKDRDKWTNEEQEALKAQLAEIRQILSDQDARMARG